METRCASGRIASWPMIFDRKIVGQKNETRIFAPFFCPLIFLSKVQVASWPSLRRVPQERDPSNRHPLDDEDVAVFVEGSVVRMHEAAGLPLLRRIAEQARSAQHLLRPSLVVAQMDDRVVVL